MTDEEIIASVKSGNNSAYDELVGRYTRKLFQIALSLLGNKEDAEEVVQDAFVRAYRGLANFRGDSTFETWITRIVINLSRNRYKWNKRRGSDVNISISVQSNDLDGENQNDEIVIPDRQAAPGEMLENIELVNKIMSGINSMSDKLKDVMVLRHVENMPYEKIAEILRCKVGTVKSRLARGREILKNILEKED